MLSTSLSVRSSFIVTSVHNTKHQQIVLLTHSFQIYGTAEQLQFLLSLPSVWISFLAALLTVSYINSRLLFQTYYIAGELLVDQSLARPPFLNTTTKFADVPTNLLRLHRDGDVFTDRRCRSSMGVSESWQSRPTSLDQRQCVSVHSSLSDRDAAEKKGFTGFLVDDLNQSRNHFLQVEAGNVLNPSHLSEHDVDEAATIMMNDLATDSQVLHRSAMNVDSPTENGSNVSHLYYSQLPSVPRDSVQDNAAVDENQVHRVPRNPATTTVTVAAASVAMTTADAPEMLVQPHTPQVFHK